MACFIAVER